MPTLTCQHPTVADLLTAYSTEYLPQKSLTSQRHYRRIYAGLSVQWGHLTLTDLTPAHLREYRTQVSQQHKPATVRAYMAYLSSALQAAVDDYEWLDQNPMRKVRRPPKPAGRIRFLTDEERTALLAACQESRNPSLYPLVVLTLSTGGRKNEVRRLRWSEVDLEWGLVLFLVTKNRRPRAVPLAEPALGLLRQQKAVQTSPWVFPNATGQRPMECERVWRTARKRAGLQDFRFHDLRHSAASSLAMSGASLQDIAEILGHTDIQQTMRYVHLVESHTRGVVERMSQRFFAPHDSREEG